jgi:hypothetical protein
MTEAEWLACEDPDAMRVELLSAGPLSERRLRLLGCACCRRLWKLMTDKRSQQAVEGAERYVEEQLSITDLQGLHDAARRAWEAAPYEMGKKANSTAAAAATATYVSSSHIDINVLSNTMGAAVEGFPKKARKLSEQRCQAILLRDVFGNPFRAVTFSQSWRTDTAVSLARQMYEARNFSAMPILADALQDAGCDNDEILDHCRQPGEHVRGCWVVDLVLGKT